ncbi:MAG: SPOR domain-containing protein [Halorhodospira sp.]
MDPSTKRQLVGAAVLIALAVIFLPMIFSGPGEEAEEVDVPVEVPPRAEEETDQEALTEQPPEDMDEEPEELSSEEPVELGETQRGEEDKAVGDDREEASEEGEGAATPDAAQPGDGPDEGPDADGDAGGDADRDDDAQSGTEEGRREAGDSDDEAGESDGEEDHSAPSADDEGAYAVQVGSFRQESNAQRERDRLRELDLPAYVERGEVEGEARYRVRLGPTMERDAAEALLEQARDEADLEGFVLSR